MFASPHVIPAFKFQMRRDTIDWRRFSAIDVERVARELDLTTLQENINSITFCNLDAEKCPYCQQPADPVFLKVFKMAQLTIEYLLHSQEYLSMNLTLQEEQHQSTLEDLKRIRHDLDKQAEELKSVKEESRRRKKMIATQQLLLQAGANNYHKCQLCDKSFMNYSFLQAHVHRRHPEATAAEKEKKKQVEQMENEIEELKVKLKETHTQLEAESQFRAQEAENMRRREKEERKKFEKWKEEERLKFQKEMEDLRNLLLTEFKDIASKNSALEGKVQELQAKNAAVSNLGTLQDDNSVDNQQWIKAQKELQAVKAKIEQQKTEWKWKLRELQKEHQVEKEELKGENERLRASLSSDQWKMAEQNKQQMALFNAQLNEQAKIIKSQEKAIKILSSSKAKEMQRLRKVEKTEEISGEELEDTLDRKKRVPETLSRDPSLLKQFRPFLEDILEEKLEGMGVKRDAKGIPTQTYKHLQEMIKKQQQQKAKTFPQFFVLRKKLEQEVKNKASWSQKDESDASLPYSVISNKYQRSLHSPIQVMSSTPKTQQVELKSYLSEVPKPAPRIKVSSLAGSVESSRLPSPKQVRSSPSPPQHSAAYHPSTSPFSSEEESIEEPSFVSPKLTARKTEAEPPTTVQHETSEWDSSDTDISEGKGNLGLSSAARTHSETRVQSIAHSLEKSLNVPGRKPTGGVKLFSVQTQEDPKPSQTPKKLQFVAEEESDLEISSLEEITQHLSIPKEKQQQTARSSGDSAGSRGPSIWSSSSSRAGAW